MNLNFISKAESGMFRTTCRKILQKEEMNRKMRKKLFLQQYLQVKILTKKKKKITNCTDHRIQQVPSNIVKITLERNI